MTALSLIERQIPASAYGNHCERAFRNACLVFLSKVIAVRLDLEYCSNDRVLVQTDSAGGLLNPALFVLTHLRVFCST